MKRATFTFLQPLLGFYRRVSTGLTVGVRVVALDAGGRVALVRHTYVAGWHLPGGGVEVGETAEAAARRELLEEAGIVAGPAPLALYGLYLNLRAARRDHVAVYVARGVDPPAAWRPSAEIAQAGLFALDGLPEGTTRATRARLAEIAEERPPAPLW